MAKGYSVATVFNATDNVSSKFVKMGTAAGRFAKKASGAFGKLNKQSGLLGKIISGNLIAGGIQKGFGMITRGIGGLVGEFVSLDDSLISAGAKFKDINLATKAGQKQLDLLRKSARDAGKTTLFTATESAKGLEFLAMAGFTSAQAMASLNTIQNLAIATNTEFAQAADMSSDLLGAFGLSTSDAAQQAKNFTRLNDVLTKTANSSNVTLETMFETMKTAAPIGKVYGATLEQIAAITGQLGSAGIKGTQAGTALKNVFLRLASPSKEAAKMMEKLNINTADSQGNMKKAAVLMNEIGLKLSTMGSKDKLEALDTIFGKIPIAGAANIIRLIPEINKMEKSLLNSAGAAKLTAEQMSKSLGNKLKKLVSGLTEKVFQLFDVFKKDGVDGLDAFIKKVDEFDMSKITIPLIAVIKFIKEFGSAIINAILVIKLMTIAQGIFNVVMAANPVGAVVLGLQALVLIGILVYKNWTDITNAVSAAFTWFMKWRDIILLILGPIGMLVNQIITLATGILDIVKVFKEGGFVAGMRMIGKVIFDTLITPLRMVLALIAKIPLISKFGVAGLETIENISTGIAGEKASDIIAPNAQKEANDRERAQGINLGAGNIDINVQGNADVKTSTSKGANFTLSNAPLGAS